MELSYRRAGIADIDLLTKTRIMVLRAANGLDENADMSVIERESREYYQKALTDGTHTAYLVFDGDRVVGTGGVSYFSVMPTCDVPDGRKAYIMNMYTDPEYRRQGIAKRTLSLLVEDAKSKGVTFISLEATKMGRPLYENYGFKGMEHEMILPQE